MINSQSTCDEFIFEQFPLYLKLAYINLLKVICLIMDTIPSFSSYFSSLILLKRIRISRSIILI
jgi:hypothetical protein